MDRQISHPAAVACGQLQHTDLDFGGADNEFGVAKVCILAYVSAVV